MYFGERTKDTRVIKYPQYLSESSELSSSSEESSEPDSDEDSSFFFFFASTFLSALLAMSSSGSGMLVGKPFGRVLDKATVSLVSLVLQSSPIRLSNASHSAASLSAFFCSLSPAWLWEQQNKQRKYFCLPLEDNLPHRTCKTHSSKQGTHFDKRNLVNCLVVYVYF